MVLKTRSTFSRSRYLDSDSWSEALYYGGAKPGVDFDLGLVTGYYGNQLRMMWEEQPDPFSNFDYEQLHQAKRPDVFVRKLPSRRRFGRSLSSETTSASPSTLITEKEFADHYTAAAFAAYHNLTCETSVTLWWGAFGALNEASAQKVFSQFLKNLNAWLHEQRLPTVYFFSHESSPKIGLHTHLAVYLCLSMYTRSAHRDEFRRWAMKWPERNGYGTCPRAIRVTGPAKQTPWLHWHLFHYQVKGYDPRAVVRTAYNSLSGTNVMLGDLIACRWQDPGIVTMAPRLGHALNLGPARRQIGIPKDCDELRNPPQSRSPAVLQEFKFGEQFQRVEPPVPPHPPFRSRYEDGWRDVRCLYPVEFNTRVTKLSYEVEPPRQVRPPAEFPPPMELI